MAIKEEEKKNGMKIVDNMDGMKNATEKLRNLGVKNFPKNITIEEAIKLINKKRAN